jgi:Ala-tRNA(Pro) deacylase
LSGAIWITDAPFRETEIAIELARIEGVLGIKTEPAALYAFAEACGGNILSLARVSTQMAENEDDFENGKADGAHDALELLPVAAGPLGSNISASRDRLLARLRELGIAATTVPYPAHKSVEEGKALRGPMAGQFTKNLLLKDKKNTLFLVVAGEDQNINLRTLHTAIGAQGRLGFAAAAQMLISLGVAPGALTPFALINDPEAVVRVVLDAALLDAAQLNFHPLVNTESTGVHPDDLLKFIRATGREPIMLSMAERSDACRLNELNRPGFSGDWVG